MLTFRQFLAAAADSNGSDGRIDFVKPSYVKLACDWTRLPDEIAEALIRGAAAIAQDAELAESARRYHRELFVDKLPPGEVNGRLLNSGPAAGMLGALVYLGALPQLIGLYEARRIPERVMVDTMEDIAVWMRHHRNKRGEWGLSQLGWLIRHMSGELFRLGRLQFMFVPYNQPVKVFRRKKAGDVIALSDCGVRFRADGQVDGTNDVTDPDGGWTASLEFDGSVYRGYPISEEGAAVRIETLLPAEHWELVLEQGMPVLDVHIPEGSKMLHELCRESYELASAFAADHFPEREFKAFVCSSWLLAPQLRRLLAPDTNIVRFQSDYYVTPTRSNEDQTLERVFGYGTKLADLPHMKPVTSLQCVVWDYLRAGGNIHNAAGFILKEHRTSGTRFYGRTGT